VLTSRDKNDDETLASVTKKMAKPRVANSARAQCLGLEVSSALRPVVLTKTALEITTTTRLVELCGKVTESATATPVESGECSKFVNEWNDVKNKTGNEARVSHLRNKMIALLSVTAIRLGIHLS
jgi:hypothetical protein